MTRLSALLLVVLVVTSLGLVHSAYEARRLYATIDRARGEERQLEVEYKRLDAERQAQATPMRVEKAAREKLKMRTATLAVTHYVFDSAASGATR